MCPRHHFPFPSLVNSASVTSLGGCCTEKLKNQDTIHWYSKTTQTSRVLFVPVGPQTFPKFTFLTVLIKYVLVVEQCYGFIASQHLITVI